MKLWDRLKALAGLRAADTHTFELDDNLRTVLVNLAEAEEHPAEDVTSDLLAAGLEQQQARGALINCWRGLLSARE